MSGTRLSFLLPPQPPDGLGSNPGFSCQPSEYKAIITNPPETTKRKASFQNQKVVLQHIRNGLLKYKQMYKTAVLLGAASEQLMLQDVVYPALLGKFMLQMNELL